MKTKNFFGLTYLFIFAFLLQIQSIKAQSPNQFKYQAVLRDASGNIIANQQKSVVIDILQSSANGTSVFTETHNATTTAQGIINLNIGSINTTGISSIDWSSNTYFIKISVGGVQMGTSQLLSVPYALYAKSSDFNNLKNKPDMITTPNTPKAGDILYFDGLNWLTLSKGTNGQTLRLDNGIPKWGEPGYAFPIVTTLPVTDIMTSAASSGGTVVSPGYTEITAKGVCWATTQNPTTANDKTSDGTGSGSFSSSLKTLLPNTTYYARAYATNGAGTAYGNQVSFKTFQNVVFPTVSTSAAINITENTAASGGNVTATGGANVTAKGICWSTNLTPTIADNKTNDGSETGQYISQMTNLAPGTQYYVRSYATNSAGTGYGSQVSLMTVKTLPVITTKNITDLSSMGGVTGGNITSSGGGTISERGICWGETPNPNVLDNKEVSPSTLSSFNLAIIKATKPNTTFYVRAFAKNELGIGYGQEKSFITTDAQYYTSFETGIKPEGWTGPWMVSNENAFDGSYGLKAPQGQTTQASIKLNLTKSSQLIFYFYLKRTWFTTVPRLELYVNNVLLETYSEDGTSWRQAVISLSVGENTISFKAIGGDNICFIDNVTITK